MSDPIEDFANAWAGVGERMADYTAVWRDAIAKNGEGNYAADDLLVDMQTLWGMCIGDAARVGAVILETLAPLVAQATASAASDQDDPGPGDAAGGG